ncbi:TPA: DNA-binding protein [Streptococcus pyogenes]|nr:DNA-binding protein [Streptococcus pyogenes]HER0772695.1 DNA-binding protein [Streptococcus pyogenes]HER8322042.1 DNA-binding protein [Streptococcus pyogenes]HES6997080.1 DNA-binding protein [Streptococcus pyogenes]
MPDIAVGREKVVTFLKSNNIKKSDLATAYGLNRQEVTNILSGSTRGPKANQFILRVIADYSIE